MRVKLLIAMAIGVAALACSHDGTAPHVTPPKPDPYITIRTRDLLDTTTASGRAHWHVYIVLTGPEARQNGVGFQGAISLQDLRLGHSTICSSVGADSIGQRFVSVVAFADTSTSELTADATPKQLADAWFAGNTTLPANWRAIANPPADAWDSQQYQAGHGLTLNDPIRWGLDWKADGAIDFYERTDSGTECAR